MTENKNDKSLTCNFCGKHREDVEKLIAGPGVYICNECISISYEIIEKEKCCFESVRTSLETRKTSKHIYSTRTSQ